MTDDLTYHQAWGEAKILPDYIKPVWMRWQAKGEAGDPRPLTEWVRWLADHERARDETFEALMRLYR